MGIFRDFSQNNATAVRSRKFMRDHFCLSGFNVRCDEMSSGLEMDRRWIAMEQETPWQK